MMKNFDESIQQMRRLIEERLDTLLSEKETPYPTLLQAARYSLLSGGKRLRPLLALLTADTLGASLEKALDPACALEMIHTYSLIHDDLPCMDNDDFRRGKPSLHKAFAEGSAVLTGDFLLTYAFEIIARASLDPQQKIELIDLLAQKAGAKGMIGGQVMDIESDCKELTLDVLRDIHERKTGALMSASIEFGAIISNLPEIYRKVLRQFGYEIGFVFQVIDDIIDVTSNKNSDKKNKKFTYVTLLGLEKARHLAEDHYREALKKLEELPYDLSNLTHFAKLLIHRNK